MTVKQIKKAVAQKVNMPESAFEVREVNRIYFGGTFEVWYLVKGQSELKSVKI